MLIHFAAMVSVFRQSRDTVLCGIGLAIHAGSPGDVVYLLPTPVGPCNRSLELWTILGIQ
jgi:hypothetical protein